MSLAEAFPVSIFSRGDHDIVALAPKLTLAPRGPGEAFLIGSPFRDRFGMPEKLHNIGSVGWESNPLAPAYEAGEVTVPLPRKFGSRGRS